MYFILMFELNYSESKTWFFIKPNTQINFVPSSYINIITLIPWEHGTLVNDVETRHANQHFDEALNSLPLRLQHTLHRLENITINTIL